MVENAAYSEFGAGFRMSRIILCKSRYKGGTRNFKIIGGRYSRAHRQGFCDYFLILRQKRGNFPDDKFG
jgi:hypothetical protein